MPLQEGAVGLALWAVVAYALVRRAQLRVAGAFTTPWLAIAAIIVIFALAVAARPYPVAMPGGIACIALTLAADADARTGYLFDAITLPAVAVTFVSAAIIGHVTSALTGMFVLGGIFGTVVVASRGRAMGMGDVKAMAIIGAAFGPTQSLFAVAIACASGILEAVVRGRTQRSAQVRFGPHLAVGAFSALVVGGTFVRAIGGR